MKFGVITFPGSNCDHDLLYCLEQLSGRKPVNLWHKDTDLQNCDMVFVPGGFSYGDYLRSGAIARFSPIMNEVMQFAQKGGYVMGICNGFQILTESGLLPGALLHNDSQKFICSNVYLKCETSDSLISSAIEPGTVLKIPIAHGEGRFYCDNKTLQELNECDSVIFRYCAENGNVTPDSNPNGAIENIAGICNKNRNVFGMMPHPERAWSEILHNTDGKKIFESILSAIPV